MLDVPTWVRPLASPLHVSTALLPASVLAGGLTRGLICCCCTGARRPSRGNGHAKLA
jgi:hypothetical protein